MLIFLAVLFAVIFLIKVSSRFIIYNLIVNTTFMKIPGSLLLVGGLLYLKFIIISSHLPYDSFACPIASLPRRSIVAGRWHFSLLAIAEDLYTFLKLLYVRRARRIDKEEKRWRVASEQKRTSRADKNWMNQKPHMLIRLCTIHLWTAVWRRLVSEPN